MKHLLLLVSFVILFANCVSAQQANIDSVLKKKANPEDPGLPIKDVINHIGSEVYIRDTISGYKIINHSLKLLFIGGKFPNQILTIVIKGRKLNKEIPLWFKNGIGHFSGKAVFYEGKPAIIVTSNMQLSTVVMI
jgi:hypothetical protein